MPEPVRCPVCDTVQPPATLCATCGLRLNVPQGVPLTGDPPVEVPPGFEPTAEAPVAQVEMAPPPGLEHDPGHELASMLNLSYDVDVPDVNGPLPGFEATSEQFERSAPPPAAQAACPYCGFAESQGRVCDNCGRVRSRVLAPERLSVQAALAPGEEPPMVRCRGCGSVVPYGPRCPQCSQPLPAPG